MSEYLKRPTDPYDEYYSAEDPGGAVGTSRTIRVRGTSRAQAQRGQLLPPIISPETLTFKQGPLDVAVTARPDRLAQTEPISSEWYGTIGGTAVKVVVVTGPEAEQHSTS